MAKPLNLSPDTLCQLDREIIRRLELQRELSQNTYAVLQAELGISESTIQNIEHGNVSEHPYKITPEIQAEVKRRRNLYHLTSELMQPYQRHSICKRYGISEMTLTRRLHLVRMELAQVCQEIQEAA